MAGIDDFIFDSSKDVCPNMDRTDAGLITQKQIRFIYVLIKQYNLDKAEVEATHNNGILDEMNEYFKKKAKKDVQ